MLPSAINSLEVSLKLATIFSFLALFSSLTGLKAQPAGADSRIEKREIEKFVRFAKPDGSAIQHYVALAELTKANGSIEKVPTIGKREYSEKESIVTDTQHYLKESVTEEYAYRFKRDYYKLTLDIIADGKNVGSGTFSLSSDKYNATICSYKYVIEGKDGYKASGTDKTPRPDRNNPNILYTEVSSYDLPGQKEPEVWKASYLIVSEAEYLNVMKPAPNREALFKLIAAKFVRK